MTTFERDYQDALNGNEIEVLERRKAELDRLYKEGQTCKNLFRRKCLAQEYVKRKAEYDEISELF